MGKIKQIKTIISRILPLLFVLIFSLALFWPYFSKGLVPIPGDILIGHYYPWKDHVWQGRVAGYPIRNFELLDGILQTYPWRMQAIEALKKGNLPLWNPYVICGMPLLANLQVAILYPLNFLFLVLPEIDAWSLYLFAQPFLASVFGYLFGRTLKHSKKGSLLLGICFGFSNIMMSHLEFGIDGHTMLWLPLALSAINLLQSNRHHLLGMVLLSGACVMTFLGGYPPPAIYSFGIIGLYTLLKIRPLFSRKIWAVFFSVLLATALAAPQLMPLYELSQKVVRDEAKFGAFSGEAYFFPWENLLMSVAPGYFGHPATNNFDSPNYFTEIPSIGIIGLIFVLFSLYLVFKKKEVVFWWVLTVGLFSLMLKTPAALMLSQMKIPVLSLVTPRKLIWPISFCLSVLASFGFEEVLKILFKFKKERYLKFIFPLIIVWEIVFFLLAFGIITLEADRLMVMLRNLILPVFFLSATSSYLLLALIFPKLRKLTFILLLGIAIELVREGIKYNSFISRELIYPEVEIFKAIGKEGHWRSMKLHPELFPVNANSPYHLATIDGYASLHDSRAGQMVALASSSYPIEKIGNFPRIIFQTEYKSKIIDLLGVKYVFSLDEIKNEKLKLIESRGKTKLYENLRVFPRAFLVDKYYVEKNDLDVVNRMLLSDLRQEIVLEKEPGILSETLNATGSAEIEKYEENEVRIKVSTLSPAILVLTDSYYPGWEATVNGLETEVLQADYNLRAVVVPKGENVVVFHYRPKSFTRGLFISILVLFSMVLLFVIKIFSTILKNARRSGSIAP